MRRALLALTVIVAAACSGTEPSTGEGQAASCPQPDAADRTLISDERAAALVGMTEGEAAACAAELGWGFRVGRRDDESFMLTADYVVDRVTVEVEDGRVVLISVG